jgi:hypothetical protein
MRTLGLLLSSAALAATPLWAQQLSGEGTCGTPEISQEVPIGDRPDHSYSVSKNSCSWTKPFEIAGQRAMPGTAVQTDERTGNMARFRGYYLDPMSGGDTVHYSYEGTTKFKDRATPESAEWNWTIANGTGKLTGLKGTGTCKGSWATGKYQWKCTGSYQLSR